MTIETLKSPNPRNQNSISLIKSKFLSVSSMNTLLAILKVTHARRDVILAGGLYHRFPWGHLPPPRVCTILLQTIVVKCDYVLKPMQHSHWCSLLNSEYFFFSNYQHLLIVFDCSTTSYHFIQLTTTDILRK